MTSDRAEYRKEGKDLSASHVVFSFEDKGGRRAGIDRRRFAYSDHVPERRSGSERRIILDRRIREEQRTGSDRRQSEDRRQESLTIGFTERRGGPERRSGCNRRTGMDRRDFLIFKDIEMP